MDFEILIDCDFVDLCADKKLTPIENKYVLSLINDFEDGSWRYEKFDNFIWDNVAETALSHKERESLIDQSHSLLIAAAKNLRLTDKEKDISRGSELAEILLYGIMKHYYQALPVVPKIFYKQNPKDNAKGADGVHIVIEAGEDFTIWFGEAKFYNSLDDKRLSKIIESVGESLITKKLKKENSIITNVNDIDDLILDENLKEKIKKALDNKASIDSLKPKIHIPILLLHECEITNMSDELSQDYKNAVIEFQKTRINSYFKKQIKKLGSIFKYSEVSFHLLLFPIPNKQETIDNFVKTAEFYKK